MSKQRVPKCFSNEPDQEWLASQAWRDRCVVGQGEARLINYAIADYVLTGSIVGNPYNNRYEANCRAALPAVIAELGRDEVITLFRIATSLLHFP